MGERYAFGRFMLDTAERRLTADEILVPLSGIDFRLLLVLVENAGAVVSKDDIVSRVWGGSAIADSVLYVHVNTLRRVLGEDFIINRPGRGYRFAAEVRRGEAPPARMRGAGRRGNLPVPSAGAEAKDGPSRLIGREAQLQQISGLLARGRLVTLTGPGGVGKTRLALAAAGEAEARYFDGAWVVELAGLDDEDLVPVAIATTLGLKVSDTASSLDALSRHLARKSLLLVLDNCEHVRASAAHGVETLLRSADGVHVLATSREPLSCVDEQILEVPPLELPPESETEPGLLRSAAAVELFVERARAAHAAFRIDDCGLGLVARICRQVDGLPLAIEMASAWAGSLGLELLDAKLGGSMNAWLRARSTAPHRHSTLQATLEWSHDLLSAPEQSVLRRLAVFAGSFSMQAAEAVAGDPAIPVGQVFGHVASLLRKSMITIVPGSRSQRYRLLETTRTFMLEKLENSDDAQPTRRRHARHVLQVLEQAKRELETTSDAVWLDCYGPLLDDLRSALTWATSDDFDEAVALAGVSWPFWRELSLRAEGRQWIGAVAARLKPGAPPALEAQLWRALSDTRMNAVPVKTALEEIERAVELYRMLDNRPELGCALTALANVLFMLGRNEEAEKTITEALAMLEPVGGPRTRAAAYSTQVYIEGALGRHDRARRAGEMAAHLATMAGAERVGLAVAVNLIEVSLGIGDIDWAISSARNLLARMEASPHTEIRGFVCGELAAALTFRGDLDEALAAARDAVPLLQSAGMLFWLFDHLALRTALVGRARDAGLVAGYADAAYRKFSRHREPIGERAVERTQLLLREALQADEIIQLAQLGAQLSEDQVLQLALNG